MSNKNSWFKHYNDASDKGSLEALYAEQDYEAISFYWWLLEYVSKNETFDKRGYCLLHHKIVKRKLGWNYQRLTRVLSKIGLRFQVRTEPHSEPEVTQVFICNWLNLQENRGGKKVSKKFQNEDRHKTKDIRHKTEDVKTAKSTTDFNNSFKENAIQIKQFLKEKGFKKSIIYKAAQIADHFENVDKLQSFLNETYLAKKKSCNSKEEPITETELERYVSVALLKEAGLL